MSLQDTCDFCGISEETETTRELQRSEDGRVVAHYNCMLYSPDVTEKDSQEDTEGFGFNIERVKREIKRGQKLKCSFCKKRGATVGCDVRSCKRNYHYPCVISARGQPVPDKYVVYCVSHKHSQTDNDTEQPEKPKKRRRLEKVTSRSRKNNIRNPVDNNESNHWQRGKTKRRLKNTTGRARKKDIGNQNNDDNGYSDTTLKQNMQINDQTQTTFLIDVRSDVEIENPEEALPSTSGQPVNSGTSSEESDSILGPRVKDAFSLSGFPKEKNKYRSNRKPSEKLQEFLQTASSPVKRELSQIYSDLGGSELHRTTEMDASWDNQNGDITTEDAGNNDVPETSTCSDNSEGDKTPERLPDINAHGIPLRCSTMKEITEKQSDKIPYKTSKNFSEKGNLNYVISMLSRPVSSDGDMSDRPGTLSGQFRSIVPQIQSAINSPRNTTKNAELNGDGQATSEGSSKSNTNDQPARKNRHELLSNRGISGEPIKKKDSVCLERSESISSKRKRFQDREELVPNMLPQETEVKLPEQQKMLENQDDYNSTEDSLTGETETPGSPLGHHSGPSEMTTPVRRQLNSLLPRDINQSRFQHERVEDLDDMEGFGRAVAGQCRRMPEDRQAKYMSYVLASAHLFRAPTVLPEVDILINNLRTMLERFQKSSSGGAYSSSD